MKTSVPCKLCGGPGPLAESHILPEFIFRPAYDSSHTSLDLNLKKCRFDKRQKGLAEALLCRECEIRLNKWETYFANVWLNPTKRIRPKVLPEKLIQIAGLNYALFKLFHLSIVWRAGVSTIPEFKQVYLGDHETKLRDKLLQDDPGKPSDYPFYGVALRNPETLEFMDEIIKGPDSGRAQGHRIYGFIFGGVLWHYCISSHQSEHVFPVNFGTEGILTLGVQNWTENFFVLNVAARMKRAGMAKDI